jgi:protein-S-isoprenylcysteine O-methyltransferase
VSTDAFLLNHSPQYHAALAAAAAEYWLEAAWLAPGLKGWGAVSLLGLALVVGGQALRSAAMWTAGGSFTHLVQEDRREGHVLVTTGVYARLRHPSYTGWFWWSVGTQLLLGNPLCALAYAAASWRFFAARVPHEEAALARMFGQEYLDYARRTAVLIPGLPSGLPAGGGGDGGGGSSVASGSDPVR